MANKFETPADNPLETICVTLELPNSRDWLGNFNKAILALCYAYNWEQVNPADLTTESAASIWYRIFEDYIGTPKTCGIDDAPFWDDAEGDDTTDDAPISGFPWYENVSDFIVTAFLAASFSPEAAIQVVTTARKFRLAFRSRDYGAILRVFVDGVLQTNVDTYSAAPGIVYANIIPAGDPPYDLRIEHSGTHNASASPTAQGYGMEVIRKRLSEAELNAIIDMRTVGGQVEVMRDDGLGWVAVTNAEYVRRDGSLNPDVSGAFVVQPTTDTLAGAFRRASSGASAAILAAQTEAGANLFSVAANGNLTLSGTAQTINAPNSEMTFQVGGAAIFYVISNLVKTSKDFQITDNSGFAMKRRISGSPVDALKLVTAFDNSTLATYRSRIDMSIAAAGGDKQFLSAGVDSGGTLPKLGVLGAAGTARQTLTGDFQGNAAAKALAVALEGFGWITDSTTLGVPPGAVDTCKLAYNLAFRIQDPLRIIVGSMQDQAVLGDTNAELAAHGAALYHEFYGSSVWWDNETDAENFIEAWLDSVGANSSADALATVETLMYSGRAAYWEGALKAALDSEDGVINTDMLNALQTELLNLFEPQYADFLGLLTGLILETSVIAYQNMGAAALLGAEGNCIPPAISPTDDCQHDATASGGDFIPYPCSTNGWYGGTWSSGGWHAIDAGGGNMRLGLRQACYMSGVPTVMRMVWTTTVNSAIGINLKRVSDGALIQQMYAANSGVVTNQTYDATITGSGIGAGWFYLEIFGGCAAPNDLIFHSARLFA